MRLALLALAGCLACDSDSGGVTATSASGARPPAATTPGPNPSPQLGARDPRIEGEPGCRFRRLEVWAAGKVAWFGDCQKGFADGSGVIVNVVEGAQSERFYGRLDEGSPSIGVLQTENGFVAGRWEDGSIVAPLPDDVSQRNVMIEAFRKGSSGAAAASKFFTKNSDAEASRFYAAQARLLDEQMD